MAYEDVVVGATKEGRRFHGAANAIWTMCLDFGLRFTLSRSGLMGCCLWPCNSRPRFSDPLWICILLQDPGHFRLCSRLSVLTTMVLNFSMVPSSAKVGTRGY